MRVCKLPTVAPSYLPVSSDGSEILAAGCLQCQRCDQCSGVCLVEYAAQVEVCVCVRVNLSYTERGMNLIECARGAGLSHATWVNEAGM